MLSFQGSSAGQMLLAALSPPLPELNHRSSLCTSVPPSQANRLEMTPFSIKISKQLSRDVVHTRCTPPTAQLPASAHSQVSATLSKLANCLTGVITQERNLTKSAFRCQCLRLNSPTQYFVGTDLLYSSQISPFSLSTDAKS